MARCSAAAWLTVFILCLCTSPASATDEAGPADGSRVDSQGDPLPAGAVSRLGTLRLRHGGSVNGVAFSPDGRCVAAAAWDDAVRVWDVATGAEVAHLPGSAVYFSVAWSPDGSQVAAVGDRIVRLWEFGSRKELWASKAHAGRVHGVAFSPDGRRVASAGADAAVRLWDVGTGQELLNLRTGQEGRDEQSVAFSSDGTLLASGTARGEIYVWNLETGTKPFLIEKAHGRGVDSLAFVPGTHDLLSTGHRADSSTDEFGRRVAKVTSEIVLWDADEGTKRKGFAELLPGQCVAAVSDDGRSCVTLHRDQVILWDLASGEIRRKYDDFHNSFGVRPQGIDLSSDGRTVATLTGTNVLMLWDAETGERRLGFPGASTASIYAGARSPDGRLAATGDASGDVRLWDAASGEIVHRLELGQLTSMVRAVCFSSDGRTLLAAGDTSDDKRGFYGAVQQWDVETGRPAARVEIDRRVQSAAFSPDGKTVAVGAMDARFGNDMQPMNDESVLALADAATGRVTRWLPAPPVSVQELAFSSDGTTLASAMQNGTILLWDVAGGTVRREVKVEGLERGIQKAAFAGDLSFALVQSTFGDKVLVVDLMDGSKRSQIDMTGHYLRGVALSADGKTAAVATVERSDGPDDMRARERAVRLIDLADGRELTRFTAADGDFWSLGFLADDRRLVSGTGRCTAIVWDVSGATGLQRRE